MTTLEWLCLAGSGLALGLAAAFAVEVRRTVHQIDWLRSAVVDLRREESRLRIQQQANAILIRAQGKQLRDQQAILDWVRNFAESEDLLAFLASTGQADEPGPDGFMKIHEPAEAAEEPKQE